VAANRHQGSLEQAQSRSGGALPGLDRVLALLESSDPGAAPGEVADALWLAIHIDRVTPGWSKHAPSAKTASADKSNKKDAPPEDPQQRPGTSKEPEHQSTRQSDLAKGDEPAAAVYPTTARGTRPARQLPAPGLPALPNALALGRALRLLRRTRPAARARVLDPDATAEQLAELRAAGHGYWEPVWRPRPRPWLDLLLILDQGPTMQVWQPLTDALSRLLVQSGIFGRIRILHLDSNAEPRVLSPGGGIDHTAELLRGAPGTGNAHRLALLVSDCIAAGWYHPGMARLIAALTRGTPALLVQTMPKRRWPDTALGNAEQVILVPAPQPTGDLPALLPSIDTARGSWARATLAAALPIVRLDAGNLRAWANALGGRSGSRTLGYLWPREPAGHLDAAAPQSLLAPDPATRLARFEAVASKPAQHLARQLACVPYPLTLPMMRLIQQQSENPPAGLEHLAEVFASGLIEPHAWDDNVADRAYHFIGFDTEEDPVGRPLRERTATSTAVRVLAGVSKVMQQHSRPGIDWNALIADPSSEGVGKASAPTIEPQDTPFALIGAEVLRRLGGAWLRCAQSLTESWTLPGADASGPPSTAGEKAKSHEEADASSPSQPGVTLDIEAELSAAYAKLREQQLSTHDLEELAARIRVLREQRGVSLQARDLLNNGRYELLRRLDSKSKTTGGQLAEKLPPRLGTEIEVWLARDLAHAEDVVLKVLNAKSSAMRETFGRYQERLDKLRHPNVVRMVESHCSEPPYEFFAMEAVSGKDLFASIVSGALNWEQGLDVVEEIARAIDYLQDNEVFPLALHPRDILLDSSGHPRLIDFDPSLQTSIEFSAVPRLLPDADAAVYVAPEQLSEVADPDRRADVFALGRIACFVIDGPGFTDAFSTADGRLGKLRNPDMGPQVSQCLLRATEPDKNRRYGSITDFRGELQEARKNDRLSALWDPVLWDRCCGILKESLTGAEFSTWIMPLQARVQSGQLIISAPNRFVKDWVKQHYAGEIRELAARFSAGAIVDVVYELPTNRAEAPYPRGKESSLPTSHEGMQGVLDRLRAKGNLSSDYTFSTFIEGKSNQIARAAGIQIARNPGATYNPLFIYGRDGVGKTHLMHALGNAILDANPGAQVIYVHSERFVSDMIRTLQHNKIDEFKARYRRANALLIDDVQFFGNKDRSQEEFFHTFNALFESKQQIVLSSDRFPKDVEGVEERLRSRFGWGLTVGIDPPDFETRVAILHSKASMLNVELPEDVGYFIAKRLRSNVRELEGALRTLVANSQFMGGATIDLAFTRDALRDIIAAQDRSISVARIQRTVASYYKINVSALKSQDQTRAVTRPRQVAMALAKELTRSSLPEIGREFGGRTHSSVVQAARKIAELRDTDPSLEKDYRVLLNKLTKY
jgi:chromosomal replication initiator protein